MFDDDTLNSLHAEPGSDDDRILALFREWVAARGAKPDGDDDDDAPVNALIARTNELRDAALAIPAAGMPGLAVKAYLVCHCELDDHDAAQPGGLPDFNSIERIFENQRTMRAFVRELPRFAPELEPFCAPFLVAREGEDDPPPLADARS